MKTRIIKFAFSLAAFGVILQTHGQGTFQNLDFEAVNLPNLNASSPPTFVSFADALPSWSGYFGTNQAAQAMYNGISLGAALITIVTSNTTSLPGNQVIRGNFTVTLDVGVNVYNPADPQFLSVAIAQTGFVPLGTRSLKFSVGSLTAVTHLSVTLNGQDIPIFPLSAGSNYQVFGGDISAFEGLTAELRFTEQVISSPSFATAFLDDVIFSPEAVPEPSVPGLFAVGSLLLGWRFWKR